MKKFKINALNCWIWIKNQYLMFAWAEACNRFKYNFQEPELYKYIKND